MASRNGSSLNAKELLDRVGPLQKIVIGAALVTVAVAAIMLRSNTTAPQMVPLFTDLQPADASAVIDSLDSRGITHELTDGGATVMVPKDSVYDLRVKLSAEGLPASNDGYALLDQQGITTSEFKQRVDYQRALEGELAKTLRAMDGVKNATVRLALPDDSLFVDTPSKTTASVMLDTGGMSALDDSAVQAVVHLVAASVKDLDPNDVTVVDAGGQVLAGPSAEMSGTATARAKAEREYEDAMAASITQMLAKVAGYDHVSVQVSASLDLTEKQATSEVWGKTDPATGELLPAVVAAESTNTENYTGTGAGTNTGVLGPDGVTVANPGSANDTYDKTSADRQYNIDRVVQQTKEAPGAVTGLHIAVLLDEGAVTADQATAITDTVKAATGIDETRGDTLVVNRMAFAVAPPVDTTTEDAAVAAASKTEMFSMVKTGALLFVLLVAIILGALSTRRARRLVMTPIELQMAQEPQLELPAGDIEDEYLEIESYEVEDEPIDDYVHAVDAAPEHLELLPPAPVDPLAEELADVVELAAERPLDVANVIRAWLANDLEEARR